MERTKQYPIGKFTFHKDYSEQDFIAWIQSIQDFPMLLRKEVQTLTDEQLNTPYREGGWTVRQVIHHCADSHMNSFCRFKLALTEDNPTVKPYHEDLWAELPDGKSAPVQDSLAIIQAVHTRWVLLMRTMKQEDFQKTFYHPERKQSIALDFNVALYAWHSHHHLGHIQLVSGSLQL
ncbi:putative metal-dependent hydrolase [Mongoliitalea daihaiensis]|nr:putative metal-dependent hydrolase [Mongoliitalea daihaiensis]